MICIFDYTDYRAFLKAYFLSRKSERRKFSYRLFARLCGFNSPSFLKMVIDGQKNLTTASISKITEALRLNKKEGNYFETMVLFAQADSEKEREHYLDRMVELRPKIKAHGLEKDQYRYLTDYRLVALRELTATSNFIEDLELIGSSFQPPIRPKEVADMIKTLLRLKLLKRDSNGKLLHGDASLTTPPEVGLLETYSYHLKMLTQAKEALMTVKPPLRDITGVTLPISKKQLNGIKQKIAAFREEIITFVNENGPPYEDVYQINIQAFPITHGYKKRGEES